jgi:hypothetical protein
MKRNIALWGLLGFTVAGCWMLLSRAIPISANPVLWSLAQWTCPVVPVSLLFHFGVKSYWVLVTNVFAYELIGRVVEGLQLRYRLPAELAGVKAP